VQGGGRAKCRLVLYSTCGAKAPIPTRVIVERMFAAKGIKPGIKDIRLLEAGVRRCLSRLEHVERENVTPARWRVTVADISRITAQGALLGRIFPSAEIIISACCAICGM